MDQMFPQEQYRHSLPHLAQTENQLNMILQTLKQMHRGPRVPFDQTIVETITYLESENILKKAFEDQ